MITWVITWQYSTPRTVGWLIGSRDLRLTIIEYKRHIQRREYGYDLRCVVGTGKQLTSADTITQSSGAGRRQHHKGEADAAHEQ